MREKIHIRSLNLDELVSFLKSLGTPRYQANQILDWLHKKHALDFSEMTNLGRKWQTLLSEHAEVSALKLREAPESGNHESQKFLMETKDGHLLESVLITQQNRRTVCVSTQLGCRIRCTFCASGKGKFGGNLSAGEIVEQVSIVARYLMQQKQFPPPNPLPEGEGRVRGIVTNVVFMGMGEPLDNYEATKRAIEILTSDWGFDLGGRRVTVSTSGLTPMIERFVKDFGGRVRLSVSLHSSDQETRSKLVPINKKYKLDELIETLDRIHVQLKREITFEYTLIQDVNDSIKEAERVARLARRLNAKVNLIPYNPIREMEYKSPSAGEVESFRGLLQEKGVRVTVRQTAGRDIDAACGQLRLDRIGKG